MEYSGVCAVGKKRNVNQDAILSETHDDMGLFVVADGMGGHSHGELASRCIVDEMKKWAVQFS